MGLRGGGPSPLTLVRGNDWEVGRFMVSTNVAGTLKGLQNSVDTLFVGAIMVIQAAPSLIS